MHGMANAISVNHGKKIMVTGWRPSTANVGRTSPNVQSALRFTGIIEMKTEKDIHPSHQMSEWKSTIVTLCDTPRFGRLRKCTGCGAEHAETVAGKAFEDDLFEPCQG
jgi:hypothetical protein